MKRSSLSLVLVAGLFASALATAQTPAAAPAGSTGLCKDGTYSNDAAKKGACRGHKGVKTWFAAAAAATPAPAAAPTPAAPAKVAAPAAPVAAAKPAAPAPKAVAPAAAPVAGGGPGQVWVNTSTKIYHCPGTKYYGKTKQGAYMTESAAKAAGDRPDHGKACAS